LPHRRRHRPSWQSPSRRCSICTPRRLLPPHLPHLRRLRRLLPPHLPHLRRLRRLLPPHLPHLRRLPRRLRRHCVS
jgi:hypothetical protein